MPSPPIFLKKNADRRLRAGHLWIYSNEIDVHKSPLTGFDAGQAVTIISHHGQPLGIGYVNPHSLICTRLLSRDPQASLNASLLEQRLSLALSLRARLFDKPFYRLVFGESDLLPGLVVDRFDDVLVVQLTTAGMERVREEILTVLETVLRPRAIVLRNDSSIRELEGLENYVEVARGTLPSEVFVEENEIRSYVPVLEGQKTGWFYDHRVNRRRLLTYVKQQRILDVFSYTGAWGIQAAVAGAKAVWCIDSSAKALEYVKNNAILNGVNDRVQTLQGDAFEVLKTLRGEGHKFDVIVLDPPAFIKRKKDQPAGEEAYRRLNQLAIQLLSQEGILVSASCSLHLAGDSLREFLGAASRQVDRHLQVLEQGHQGPDHPVHPVIPETNYLKTFICRVL
jgi:23S rRNA (cytosine1962-C5)-methyltransferase